MQSNILVVEDEPAIQELIAVNLEHAGHGVTRAGSAEQAEDENRRVEIDSAGPGHAHGESDIR